MRALVVFYSRTGTTRKVAETISGILNCDVEKIVDTKNRAGALGYLASGVDAMLKKLAVIQEPKRDPALYDVAIIGTPVWVSTMASPIRTYLSQNRERFKKVAFFCTEGGSGGKKALKAMEDLCGTKPIASLELTGREVVKGGYIQKVEDFINEINRVAS